jgi:hypothetical protein
LSTVRRTAVASLAPGGINFKKMAKTILLSLFCIFVSSAQGQQSEELTRVICDSTNFTVTNFPPKLNMTAAQLESILNQEMYFGNQSNDSISFLYLCAVISCDGVADYTCINRAKDSADTQFCKKIINVFKSNCQWTPGKLRKDYYENALVKQGNKYVYKKRRVIENIYYTYCMKFELKNGRISIKTKINTP